MIKVISRRTINPKYFEEIKRAYEEFVVPGSRNEPGNISYELYQDINDPYTLVILEEWEAEENQDFHEQTEHYKKIKELLQISTQRSSDLRFLKRLK